MIVAVLDTNVLAAAVMGLHPGIATHLADDAILATALSAQASFLVTGDRKLLALGTFGSAQIVAPREFLDILAASTASNTRDTHGR